MRLPRGIIAQGYFRGLHRVGHGRFAFLAFFALGGNATVWAKASATHCANSVPLLAIEVGTTIHSFIARPGRGSKTLARFRRFSRARSLSERRRTKWFW